MLLTDDPLSRSPRTIPSFDSSLCYRDAVWCFERFASFLTATAWRWKQGDAIPDERAWDLIVDVLENGGPWKAEYHVWNAATMFYYFHTRRKPISDLARKEGHTEYTGILQEMIAEVPTRGTDRLQRKLSLDVNWFIPKYVDSDYRNGMVSMAYNLASRYGFELRIPDPPAPPAPDPVSWREWFDSTFGFGQSRHTQKPEDEEKGGKEEKLIEVDEKEESE